MNRVYLTFALGLLALSLVGFLSPLWYLGFAPLGAGLLWASYDLVEVPVAEPSPTPQRTPLDD